MKVILAGMPKTGTKSMSTALTLLGYKTHDFIEHFWYNGDEWARIIRDGGTKYDIKRMYKEVYAVVGSPCNFYWKEMLEAFPHAKVILTIRDEDSWCRSRRKQYKSYDKDIPFRMMLCLTYSVWKLSTFMYYQFKHLGCQRKNLPWLSFDQFRDETAKQIYRKHNKNILKNCPKENLLVFEVSQGWKPLCEFLGLEVPNQEFPLKNKSASVLGDLRKGNAIMQRMQAELYISLLCLSALVAIILYGWRSFT